MLLLIVFHISKSNKDWKFGCRSAKPGFHNTANATTTTQKQSDYKGEQSSFALIAFFFYSKLVVVVVLIGLMETRLK